MNRVETPTSSASLTQLTPPKNWTLSERLDKPRLFCPPTSLSSFMPMHYEAGYAYPLIVWLHDNGLNEDSLPQVMPHISLRNFVAVAPRATQPCGTGFAWQQSASAIEAAEEAVADAIRRASEMFHIHPQRIMLVGHGQGGTMALRVALRHPQQYAAVASIAGALPRQHAPLAKINQLRELPVMLASGRVSRCYPQQHACDDLRLLHTAGCQVAFRQYPDDELADNMLGDLNKWLMEIVCGTRSAVVS
jgi:phospholipase/carboxylesterase